MGFGRALKRLRAERGWRQEDLVSALDNGFARSTLANVEIGRERPSPRLWHLITQHLPEWVETLEPHYAAAREGAPHSLDGTERATSRSSGRDISVTGPFHLEQLQLVYNFRYSRAPEEIIEIRRVRALRAGPTAYSLHLTAPGRTEFQLDEEVLWGGELVDKKIHTDHEGVRYERQVAFGRRLQRGQSHEFAVRSWVERDSAPDDDLGFTVTVPTDVAVIHVNFHGPHVPRAVWAVGPLDVADLADPRAADTKVPVRLGPGGSVRVHFNELRVGSSYGMSWEWDAEH